jgi:rubrerythrin
MMDATNRLASINDHDCRAVMEFALNIEIQAYDLYRNMANILTETTAQDAFLSIAQMEKKHMELLARVFKECAR